MEEYQRSPATKEWLDGVGSTDLAMLLVDADFVILGANRAFLKLIGESSNNTEGKKCFAVVHGLEAAPSWCLHRECLATGAPVAKRFFEPHLSAYLLVSVSPIVDAEGAARGSFHVMRDVSGLASADEKDLKRSHDWLKSGLKAIAGILAEANKQQGVVVEIDSGREDVWRLFKRTEALLEKGRSFMKVHAATLIFASERERRKVARQCYGVTTRVAMLSREFRELGKKLKASGVGPAEENPRALVKAAVELSRDFHRLARMLCPGILKEADLPETLEKECIFFSVNESKEMIFSSGKLPRVRGLMSIAFVSILEEILAGVAQTGSVGATVKLSLASNVLTLTVSGEGVNYDPDFEAAGPGFSAVPEWVRALKGEISIEALPEKGNRVTVKAPFVERRSVGAGISERQREVLALLAEGHPVKQIGAIIGIATKTVEFHKYRLMKRLGVKSVPELIRLAIKEKLIAL